MASIKLNNYEIFSQSGDAAPKLNNSTGLNFSTTNQNFTIKGIDAPIVGVTNSTKDNPNSGQLAIYNGATKLWGINESGWVQQPNVPAFYAYPTTATTIANASETTLIFNAVRFDNTNSFDTTNYRFTAPIDGKYFFGSNVIGSSVWTANRFILYFFLNGSNHSSHQNYRSGTDTGTNITSVIEMSAGDYVYMRTYQDSGASRTNLASATWSYFYGYLIG